MTKKEKLMMDFNQNFFGLSFSTIKNLDEEFRGLLELNNYTETTFKYDAWGIKSLFETTVVYCILRSYLQDENFNIHPITWEEDYPTSGNARNCLKKLEWERTPKLDIGIFENLTLAKSAFDGSKKNRPYPMWLAIEVKLISSLKRCTPILEDMDKLICGWEDKSFQNIAILATIIDSDDKDKDLEKINNKKKEVKIENFVKQLSRIITDYFHENTRYLLLPQKRLTNFFITNIKKGSEHIQAPAFVSLLTYQKIGDVSKCRIKS